jgi:hypothetical protein
LGGLEKINFFVGLLFVRGYVKYIALEKTYMEVTMADVKAVNPSAAPAGDVQNKAQRAKPPKDEGAPKVSRPRLPKLPDEHVITVLKPDAKSGASAVRYNVYKTGMTIKQYVEIMSKEPHNRSDGQIWADIRWDTDPRRNLIHVGPTIVPVPPPPPPKEKKSKKKEGDQATTQPAA